MRKELHSLTGVLCSLIVGTLTFCPSSFAAQIVVSNSSQLVSATSTLTAGDELILVDGEYALVNWTIRDISGTASNWITIRSQTNAIIRGT